MNLIVSTISLLHYYVARGTTVLMSCPSPVLEFPEDLASNPERGSTSQEKSTQEEREKGTLSALYINAAVIPESPAEPASQVALEQVDADVRVMVAGAEVQPLFFQAQEMGMGLGGPLGGFIADRYVTAYLSQG